MPHKRKRPSRVELHFSQAEHTMLEMVCKTMQITPGRLCGSLLRPVLLDLYKRLPGGTRLRIRPKSMVYRVVGANEYAPLAEVHGNERVWVLSRLPLDFPEIMGGGSGFICDLTVDSGHQGFEARSVVVRDGDVYV